MSRQYLNDRWCVRCGRTSPTPYLVQMHKRLGLAGKALRVLDIGCGNGRNTQWMQAQGHTVLSVDMAPGKGSPCKKCVLGHDALPVKRNWAQVILLNYVLMFLDEAEREQLYEEILHVACPTYPGCLVVVETYPAKDSHAKDEASCGDLITEIEEALAPDATYGTWANLSELRGVLWMK